MFIYSSSSIDLHQSLITSTRRYLIALCQKVTFSQAQAMGTRPRTERQQLLFDRLTAMLPSSGVFRRWWEGRPALTAELVTNETARLVHQPQITSLVVHNSPDTDAPVALLLPGMAELTVGAVRHIDATSQPTCNLTAAIHGQVFVHKPARQPDLFLNMLSSEIHFAIFDAPELSLYDLLALRKTCHTLRHSLPISIMERKLKVQNYAGWEVVFEMHGHRYPGTTYGNRRLCGRCVIPKIRGHLIQGAVVRAYLARRRALGGNARWAEPGGEWPDERAMCFSCLFTILSSMKSQKKIDKQLGLETPTDAEVYKLAAISTQERFLMLDGTTRKMCDRCTRDIHENAVPCPHCSNFSEWCKARYA
ncbi:hypothetical protein B0T25DRAFT_536252 [Lasiosphaeria hispida]|uniref:Uncharacterized protein n=1 Tax=Lasiosphaeria hispida TaxID=260671 RepID=A0AAJ0HT18_9PEZI|nr:hypothetical protein B0T25DRAFT_536252 [Lasiosphaeria hispida]